MKNLLCALVLGSALLAPSALKADDHRYYDKNSKDWHEWNEKEDKAYRHYLKEQHKQYHDWAKAKKKEQKEYWKWRHQHADWDDMRERTDHR